MLIHFRESAHSGPVRVRKQLDLTDTVRGRSDLLSASPLEVDLTATYDAGDIHVTGHLATTVETACSRCLKTVKTTLDIPFDEVFAQGSASKGEEGGASADDDIHRVDGDTFDLEPYVNEYVQTELPLVSLCQDACAGLCPVCGTDRNESPCDCKEERIDPRLEGLKDFFKNTES